MINKSSHLVKHLEKKHENLIRLTKMTRRFEMTDKKCIDDSKVDPNIIIISDDQDNQHEIEELELMWGIKGGPRKLTMQDYHASIHETYAEESLDNINQESRGEIIADLSDEEYLFCLVRQES